MTRFFALMLSLAPISAPAQDEPSTYLLVTNAMPWDAKSDTATAGMNVLMENNLITQISA